MKKLLLPIFGCAVLFLGACNHSTTSETGPEANPEANERQVAEHAGDIREETVSANVLPDFLHAKPEHMQTVYQAAAKHQDLLEQMPCYCGCGHSVGHQNNYDCFVHENKADRIIWDDHGTKCGVCLEIAAEAISQYQQGVSVQDIRKAIDEKYESGYADPTPTPAI